MKNNKISVRELIASIDVAFVRLGDIDRVITKVTPIDQADEQSLAFCDSGRMDGVGLIKSSKAAVIICSPETISFAPNTNENFLLSEYRDRTLICVQNPRLVFMRLVRKFFESLPNFTIGQNCYISPEAKIGEGTILFGNNYIYDNVKIGKNCLIHAGTVIGSYGFGYEFNEKNEWERFPQVAGVVIGDNVEIGSNCSIDCGALVDTRIGDGTKIDNLVHIAHNVQIGKHCIIVAVTVICGSAEIGDYTWVGAQACVQEWVKVGRNVLIVMGSVVTKDIPDDWVVMGVPAKFWRMNTPLKEVE